MLTPVRTVAPATTPVSLSDVKAHCRVSHNDDDTVLTSLLNAAVAYLDGWSGVLGRCLVTQTWRQDYGSFGCLRLPLGPVASIASITYYDAGNEQQTLSTDLYDLFTDELGSYVGSKPGQSWPSAYSRDDAVSVTFVAGTASADVPAPLKAAIMLLVSHWNENREAATAVAMVELPLAVDALISPHRRMGL